VVCHRWKAPSGGLVKVNWDAPIDMHNRKTGIGVIVCDYMGEVLATMQSLKGNITYPVVEEYVAALRVSAILSLPQQP
jgi:hypothetical protein